MVNKFIFKMPACQSLKDRISTINNAYATGITPYIRPDNENEIDQYYKELGVKKINVLIVWAKEMVWII